MRGFQLDRVLAGTALALVLTLAGQASAQSNNPAAIEAGVPVPEPANVPPPTAADLAKEAPTVTPAAKGTMFETPRTAAPAPPPPRHPQLRHHAPAPSRDAAPRHPSRRRQPHPPGHPSIRFSPRSCATFSPAAATASSAAKARKPLSKLFIASAVTRRSGSITARRARARPKRSPICAASMPMAWSRPNIRCPISNRPMPPQWRKPNSNSPTRS